MKYRVTWYLGRCLTGTPDGVFDSLPNAEAHVISRVPFAKIALGSPEVASPDACWGIWMTDPTTFANSRIGEIRTA